MKYKGIYVKKTFGGRVKLCASFMHQGKLHCNHFPVEEERAAALWMDKKRISLGLEPINILKRVDNGY